MFFARLQQVPAACLPRSSLFVRSQRQHSFSGGVQQRLSNPEKSIETVDKQHLFIAQPRVYFELIDSLMQCFGCIVVLADHMRTTTT